MTLSAPSWLFSDAMHCDACQFYMQSRWARSRAPVKEFLACVASREAGRPLYPSNASALPPERWYAGGWLSEQITHSLWPHVCPAAFRVDGGAATLGDD